MRKFVVSLVCLLVCCGAFAQHKQFVGFLTGAWYDSETEYKYVQFQPKYGYHFNQWFALGITLDYSYTSEPSTKNTRSTLYGINPFIRLKHVCTEPSAAPIILFADLGVNYGVTKNHAFDTGEKLPDGENMYIGARPGIAYVIGDRFSVAAYFGFIGYRHSSEPSGTNNGTGFTLTTNGLALGLNVHFK